MNLSDLIALAKSGYKKKDIDELLKLELPEEDNNEPDPESEKPEEDQEMGDQGADDPAENDPEDILKIKEENEKLKKEIADLQKKNRAKSIDNPTDSAAERSKRLEEMAKKFM